ncbi:MAG: hypothetical protein IJA24_02950 [Alistipes sp.]|nr:hypothetical protein [Alistipes sp.]
MLITILHNDLGVWLALSIRCGFSRIGKPDHPQPPPRGRGFGRLFKASNEVQHLVV